MWYNHKIFDVQYTWEISYEKQDLGLGFNYWLAYSATNQVTNTKPVAFYGPTKTHIYMREIAFILTSVVNISYKANFDAEISTIFCGQKKVCMMYCM